MLPALSLADDTLFRFIRSHLETVEIDLHGASSCGRLRCLAARTLRNTCPRASPPTSRTHGRCARNPVNFGDRFDVARGGDRRIERRETEAGRLYEEAIRLGREFGFVQIEAMASDVRPGSMKRADIRTVVFSYLTERTRLLPTLGSSRQGAELNAPIRIFRLLMWVLRRRSRPTCRCINLTSTPCSECLAHCREKSSLAR